MLPTTKSPWLIRHRFELTLTVIGLISAFLFIANAPPVGAQTTSQWSFTGNLNQARRGHTATLLPNGKVLIAGGFVDVDLLSDTSTSEVYDPATGTWSNTGKLNTGHVWHTATLLQNGKVLVAGGTDARTSAELYDPATGIGSRTGDPNRAHYGHTASLLQNGKVLIAGGFPLSTSLSGEELYDPATGTWSNTGSLNTSRSGLTATLLQNGKVLIAGGFSNCSS